MQFILCTVYFEGLSDPKKAVYINADKIRWFRFVNGKQRAGWLVDIDGKELFVCELDFPGKLKHLSKS